jgi:hypothetical protein
MLTTTVNHGSSLDFYEQWGTPTTIISDGAYGIGGFDGDPKDVSGLVEWYRPHVEAWSRSATTETSLWFWNTEIGWATVHPLLLEAGWEYVQLITWDKGVKHIAGNVNSNTIRRFPVATEVSGLYVRPSTIAPSGADTDLTVQEWLRAEWRRAGFTMASANKVCGVTNAASRKWLTSDSLWYMPPHDMFLKLKNHANVNGKPEGMPYFESTTDFTGQSAWTKLRSKWNHLHGYTNVWSCPPLRTAERVKNDQGKNLHTNQKPLELMKRQISATTDAGDVVWEPFGGLCSASVAAKQLGRHSYAAEPVTKFYEAAQKMLSAES